MVHNPFEEGLHTFEPEDPYGVNTGENSTVKTNPVKRIRWATHRASPQQGRAKRRSILARLHKRSPSDKSGVSEGTESEDSINGDNDFSGKRTIYFNTPLPASARDEDGHPLVTFTRNKIRTAKYTPLSFLPKNLWFQFHNIANIYFLFIILLSVSQPHFKLRFILTSPIDRLHLRCHKSRSECRSSDHHSCNHFHQRCYRGYSTDNPRQ